MVRVGLVRAEGDVLRLDPTVQPWLALVWSGHVLQIEHLPLAGRAFAEAVDETGELLLFLGPPGQRIVSLRLTGEAMRRHVQGGATLQVAIGGSRPPSGTTAVTFENDAVRRAVAVR